MPQIPPATLSDPAILAAYLIFIASYLVFAIGKFPGLKIDRPAAAIVGAVGMVGFRILPVRGALAAIDFSTVVLLFAMMVIVGSLHLAGFFEWTAATVLKHLRPSSFLPAVIFTAGFLSAFLVNDIVCLVMVPFVLNLTKRMHLPALPFLLAVATASNIGSVATITGNPQNMLIGSYSRIHYSDFLLHLGPVAVIGLLLDWGILVALFRHELMPVQAESEVMPPSQLNVAGLWKPAMVVTAVVLGFLLGAAPAMAAALGSAVILISRTTDSHRLYGEVDWGLLVFFVGLFLIVAGAENAGIVKELFSLSERYLNLHKPGTFVIVAALFSNIVSNVPAVMLLKSLVAQLPTPHSAWLLLAMSSTLAGNLTITGSVANIIVVESARPDMHIGFRQYFRAGLPITAATLLIGYLWLRIFP